MASPSPQDEDLGDMHADVSPIEQDPSSNGGRQTRYATNNQRQEVEDDGDFDNVSLSEDNLPVKRHHQGQRRHAKDISSRASRRPVSMYVPHQIRYTDDTQREMPRRAMHKRHSYHAGASKPPEPLAEDIPWEEYQEEHKSHFVDVLRQMMEEVCAKQKALQEELNEQRGLFQDLKTREEDTLKTFLGALSKQREDYQKQINEDRARFEEQCRRDREEHREQMERLEQRFAERNNRGCFQQ